MSRSIQLLALVSLTAAAHGPSHGQRSSTSMSRAGTDTVSVGHAALRRGALRVGSDTVDVFADRDGKRQLVSTSVTNVVRQGDRYVVTFLGHVRGGDSVDSVFVSAADFATIRHVEVQPTSRADLVHHDGVLSGPVKDSTGEHRVELPVTADRLDFSIVGTLETVLPLAAGYEAIIRTYDISPRQNKDVVFRVIGREMVSWHGRDVDAWKVVNDFGTHKATLWLATAGGRTLQWELAIPNVHMIGVTR